MRIISPCVFTDSHSVSALRSGPGLGRNPTGSLRQGHARREPERRGEMLSDVMEQAVAAPRFRNYDQALLLTEGLVQTAMEDEHNLSLQLHARPARSAGIFTGIIREFIHRRLALFVDMHNGALFLCGILIAGMTFVI